MAKRVLVPLSGREGDEGVLDIIGAMARESGASVRLLRIFPVPEMMVGDNGRVVAYVDQEMDRLTRLGLAELRDAEVRLDGVPVEGVVRFGEPATEIVLEAEAWAADLIAFTTTRRSWLAGALAPSVAAQVSRRTTAPTLTLQA
jgi:nucleotide-binding universal stress UspA family protein